MPAVGAVTREVAQLHLLLLHLRLQRLQVRFRRAQRRLGLLLLLLADRAGVEQLVRTLLLLPRVADRRLPSPRAPPPGSTPPPAAGADRSASAARPAATRSPDFT